MASSNRHWPSMFKSKPSHHQWQNDITSPPPAACNRTPYTPSPGPGCEERTPEPKPRWNPRPEQIRILEAIFNSGMVNPPRDEIRKIRVQLQEYGQVGDANVFYWFQNRKSRSKHKLRQLHNAKTQQPPPAPPSATSSSSSSNNSSPNDSSDKSLSLGPTTVIDLLNSPTASVNQPYFHPTNDFLVEPFFFPVHPNAAGSPSQGICFADVADQTVENTCPGFLYSELMLMGEKKFEDDKMKPPQEIITFPAAPPVSNFTPPVVPPSFGVPSPDYTQNFQGGEAAGPTKSTVFINDVCFEVGVGPFNVKEAFGDDAVLIGSTGQAVLTNEWGMTVQPLQHGAFYYLIRPFTPSPHDRTMDLI